MARCRPVARLSRRCRRYYGMHFAAYLPSAARRAYSAHSASKPAEWYSRYRTVPWARGGPTELCSSKLPEFAERRALRTWTRTFALAGAIRGLGNKRVYRTMGLDTALTIPERCRLEIYWQTMPDETREDIEAEFLTWWNEILGQRPDLFPQRPVIDLPMRWLPGCSIPPNSEVVAEFTRTAGAIGLDAPVQGLDSPSDMYIFQRTFGIPALMWGPRGQCSSGDEYVDIASLYQAFQVLAHFVADWCGSRLFKGIRKHKPPL